MQNKTLLAKIVGLVAVMCLALAMVFGLVGCGGKTVSKTSIENGHLIVTYSDNTTEDLGSVIGPKGDKGDQGEIGEVHDCAHENYALMGGRITLEEYNEMAVEDSELATGEDFCYLELAICKDCKYVILIPYTEHEFVDTVVDATCTEEGYTAKVCEVCGYAIEKTDIVEALGHDYVVKPVRQYLSEDIGNFCEDGGLVVTQCNRCGDISDYVVVDALGHQSLDWRVAVEPTMQAEGLLVGYCEICGRQEATRVLPKLDKEGVDYEYILNNEFRAEEDSDYDNYDYTITIYFEEYDLVDGEFVKTVRVDEEGEEISQTFFFSELQPHMTNGKNYVGHQVVENYTVGMDGIKLFENSGELNCEEPVPAYFICTECGGAVTVNVLAPHTAPEDEEAWDIVTEPTCEEPGLKIAECVICGAEIEEEIPALGHDYITELEALEGSDNVNIIITCSRCDYENIIENVAVEVEKVDPTCTADGYVKYTYIPEDAEEGDEPIVLEIPLAMLAHTLDGEEIDLDIVYNYGDKNFLDFVNEEIGCGEAGIQYFKCDACGGAFTVHVIRQHVAPEDFEPSCAENADNSYICANCGELAFAEAPDHVYYLVESGEINEQTGKVEYIIIGCENCDYECEYLNCTYEENITQVATCEAAGLKDLIITTEEGVFTIEDVVITKLAHVFNGENIYEDQEHAYPAGFEGLTITVNNPENCAGEGLGFIICDVCHGPVLVYAQGPHKPIEDTIVEHPATCEEKGYIEYTCEICGEDIVEYTTNAIGHKYITEITVYPNDYATGTVKVTCENCDFEEILSLPAYNEGNYVIDPEAKCNAEGLGTYTFVIVLENEDEIEISFTDIIPVDNHNLVGEIYTIPYTDEEEVEWIYYIQKCADCGEWVVINIVEAQA